jgi:hypothetical protein
MVPTDFKSNATLDLPDPDAPEFAGIHADLARLYMRHRVDLAMTLASDAWVIQHTNDITMTLWTLTQHAIDHGYVRWLTRHYWWLQAATRLNRGKASAPLDG